MTWTTTTLDSPCGPLFCAVDVGGAVVRVEFLGEPGGAPDLGRLAPAGVRLVENAGRSGSGPAATLEALKRQLGEYFAGRRRSFDLELAPRGTPFQLKVWAALREIPYGETRSYGELARGLGRPRASRAVGAANGANPIPIVIPCHRVVGCDGSLTGFGGGLAVKALLLDLEAGGRPRRRPRQLPLDLPA
jgi:methylated-DNA-[protein]-cysteine S-methyltransferase